MVVALIPISGISAQTGEVAAVELDVLKRVRPDWDSSGIRWAGGFTLYPSLELGIAGDDNIYRQFENTTRDTIRYTRPRVVGRSNWGRHEFWFDAHADFSDFAAADSENITNWSFGLGGRADISRDAWLSATLALRELHEERGDPESPFTALEPVSRNVADASIKAFRRLNRLSFDIEWRYSGLSYENAIDAVTGRVLTQNDRDRDQRELSARVALDIAPGYEIFLRSTQYDHRYDRFQGEERFNRDSDGSQTVLGVQLNTNALLGGEMFAGYRRQAYNQDERLPEVQGTSYGGALTWNVTPLTTIRGEAQRRVNESALRQASGYFSTALNLSLDHELRRNMLIGGEVGLTRNKYRGIVREDEILAGTVRAIWKITRAVEANLGLRIQHRDSTFARNDYDKNYVFVNLKFSL